MQALFFSSAVKTPASLLAPITGIIKNSVITTIKHGIFSQKHICKNIPYMLLYR